MSERPFELGRFRELEPIAVVDIGSNSVRLVVYEGAVRAPFPLFNEKLLCGLGRSLTTDGRLSGKSTERAFAALRRFRVICRSLGAKNIMAIATAAVREARDGAAFIRRAEDLIGADIQVLSGEREAELAANGIRMGFQAPDGLCGDLGGGSLELINLVDADLEDAVTLPLGGLRLIDRAAGRADVARKLISEDFAKVAWLKEGRGRRFYAIGGTWRALAKLHMEVTNAPLRVTHGYSIRRNELIAFCEDVADERIMARIAAFKRVSKSRRETMPYGALVLRQLLQKVRPSEVRFSIYGIREGLLFSYLAPAERARDPLLAFCEDYARLRSRSYDHAVELCAWTDRLYASLGLVETEHERRLRHAACLVSDIEWRAQPDHRGELSLYVLAHAPAAGLDHDDRHFISLAAYFRHAGRGESRGDEPSTELRKHAPKRLMFLAKVLAAAVRTAHMLSIGLPGILDDIGVSVERGDLRLHIPAAFADFDGERLRRRLGALATLLELKSTSIVIEA